MKTSRRQLGTHLAAFCLALYCSPTLAAGAADTNANAQAEQCREAAGFAKDGRLLGRTKPSSIELCKLALESNPNDSSVAAYLGRALERNGQEEASFAFIKRSADAGNRIGQFLLGVAYEYGYGVKIYQENYITPYRQAAEAGQADAQFHLVEIKFNSRREHLDVSDAMPWLEKAAAQDHCGALNFRGWMSAQGIGQAKNEEEATRYFLRAAKCGSDWGAFNASLHLLETDGARAIALLRQAAQAGIRDAQTLLGEVLMRGRIVPRDDAQAEKWLLAAIEDYDDRAVRLLFQMAGEGRAAKPSEAEIDRLAQVVVNRQGDRIFHHTDKEAPWPIVWEPGVEWPAWKLAERYMVRITASSLTFLNKAGAAWKMYELLQRIGPAAANEILVDAIMPGQAPLVQRGGAHFTRYYHLASNKPQPPVAQVPEKRQRPEPRLDEKLITAAEFRRGWKPATCGTAHAFDDLHYATDEVLISVMPLLLVSANNDCVKETLKLIGVRFPAATGELSAYVLRHMKSTDEDIRSYAVGAASAMRMALSADQVAALLHDSSMEVKTTTLTRAVKSGWPLPPALLADLIDGADDKLAKNAIEAAVDADSPEARRALIAQLEHPTLSAKAGETLAGFDSVDLGPGKLKQLRDLRAAGEPDFAAEQAMRGVDPVRLMDALTEGLRAPMSAARRATLYFVSALGVFDARRDVEALLAHDANEDVRADAAKVLGGFELREALPALVAAMKDHSAKVRLNVFIALSMDRQRSYAAALALRDDPDPEIRALALKDLDKLGLAGDSAKPGSQTRLAAPHVDTDALASTLGTAEKLERLCGADARKKGLPSAAGYVDELIRIAGDIGIGMGTREKSATCLLNNYAKGLSSASMHALVQIGNDPVSSDQLRYVVFRVLQDSNMQEAAGLLLKAWFDEFVQAGTCARTVTETKLRSFAPPLVERVAQPYLHHPDPIIKAYGGGCLPSGGRSEISSFVRRFATDSRPGVGSSVLELLGDADDARLASAVRALRKSLRNGEAAELRLAFWSTGTPLASREAKEYRGPLKMGMISSWSKALATLPDSFTLQLLLQAIPRSDGDYEPAAEAAIRMSERVPNAVLDDALVSRIAPLLRETISIQGYDQLRTFSPLEFRAFCDGANPRDWYHRQYYDKIFDDAIKVLPSQHAALKLSIRDCLGRLTQPIPADLATAAVRLLINGGLWQDAASIAPKIDARIAYRGRLEKSRWLQARAEIQLRAGRYDDALAMVNEIEEQLRHVADASPKRHMRAQLMLIRGWAGLKRGDGDGDALPALNAALRGDPSTRVMATSLALSHGLFEPMLAAREAIVDFNESVYSSSELRAAVADLLGNLIEYELNRGNVEQGLIDADQLASLQSSTAADSIPTSLFGSDREQMLRYLAQLENRLRLLSDQPNRDMKEFRQALQDLKSWQSLTLARYPTLVALLRPVALDVQRLQRSLGADRVMVQYLMLPRSTMALVVDRDDIKLVRVDADAAKLKNLIEDARQSLASDLSTTVHPAPDRGAGIVRTPRPQKTGSALANLSRILIDPIEKIAAGKKEWVIVPHGVLHSLPFAALSAAGAPVLKNHVISTLGRAAQVEFHDTAPVSKVVAFGNPTAPGMAWASLPGAEAEIDSIANIMGRDNANVFVGAKARKEVLLDRPLGNAILHFAVHGQALPGIESRLLLADGFLTTQEVWSLPLQDTPLVVLSACETGLGDVLLGNNVLSLANAFMFAGARNVVASLWPISDAETRIFMQAFYRRLLAGDAPKAALAAAQRAASARGDPPNTWAAFVIYGS